MVWGCMSDADMYCDVLKQSMIPSLRRLGCRAVFHGPKHTSKTTTALLKKLRVKVMDWPSMSQDFNPIEHLWGILKWKVEERKVSNIHQLHDVVMEEWKRTPVTTCEALVNSMPKKVMAVLENNGGHTKYWPNWTFLLRGVLTFVASGLENNGCVCWVILMGQQIYTVIQAVQTYIVAKCNFFSVVTWKYINIYKNVRGVLTSVRYYRHIYIKISCLVKCLCESEVCLNLCVGCIKKTFTIWLAPAQILISKVQPWLLGIRRCVGDIFF